jgi:hypothetical protein
MANLAEHVMMNKWDDDINNAIISVGGKTEGSSGLPDYANIIRNQLISKDNCIQNGKEILLEGDSCIIEADETGRDNYNTEYAIGVKTGLVPGTLYLRICTAVKDLEPIYIDLTRLNINDDLIDIDSIIAELLNSRNFMTQITNDISENISQDVESLVNDIITENTMDSKGIDINELNW